MQVEFWILGKSTKPIDLLLTPNTEINRTLFLRCGLQISNKLIIFFVRKDTVNEICREFLLFYSEERAAMEEHMAGRVASVMDDRR